ncbi:DUF4397 domain-containing protein [Pedobacter punctiformis]|uniref:DUF4397 domain-containing protein n=1 Tax=Pedobacter punctiformis TaxID=3004097 RepID=A0ABT4L829_9SPHI|nr:DUF4397 domain-containing protein [Pedobacter sp. HCMS5-2]MCZ4244077.1 DUF4397 domain-containing protein [Pedobacter sp. HCMS5-2]
MKTISFLKSGLTILTIAATLSACKKSNNVTPVPEIANLSVVHVAPGLPELSFYVNGMKATTKPLIYTTALDYGQINVGKSELSVTKKDQTDVLTKSVVEFKSGKNYSLFIADVPGKTAFVFAEDDLTAPAADKVKIRFVNMSPDVEALDFNVQGKQALFTNQAFKAVSKFESMDAANEITFEIKATGKTEVLSTLSKVKIEKGKIYTILVKGLKGSTDEATKLALTMITNK